MQAVPQPTPEMLEFFQQRTWQHIHRVRHCLGLLANVTGYAYQLQERALAHDLSKFDEPERTGYIWITEYFRHRRQGRPYDYPSGIEPLAAAAKEHHYLTNRHHIEYHASPADMLDVDLIELVCDWTAMAQEYGEANASALGWAKRVLADRWQFPKPRADLIFSLIEQLDDQIRLGKIPWSTLSQDGPDIVNHESPRR